MGEVWVAKQIEPVKRKVALKLIKTGMDSRAVLQRFDQERQALALMDHPNIAKVLDGGITPIGQPFFVMELVNGLLLTKFCDEARLTTKERLELFVAICQAVQHAHQKGIVHRDLKPANILVTIIDGKPVPKVIDFGVAKATAGKLTDVSLSTQFGAVVGTLEYMSPEQASFFAIKQKLAAENPKDPDYREGVALALDNLGELAHALGREAEARDDYNQAIALRERLVAENPTRTLYRSSMADALRRRGLARRALGDPAGAAADVRRALGLYEGLPSRSADEWFETACCHAALASLAGRDGAGVSAAEGTAEADQAMALIWKAVDMGYRDGEAFRTDWALDPIHDREEFKKLLAELEKTSPAKPK